MRKVSPNVAKLNHKFPEAGFAKKQRIKVASKN